MFKLKNYISTVFAVIWISALVLNAAYAVYTNEPRNCEPFDWWLPLKMFGVVATTMYFGWHARAEWD